MVMKRTITLGAWQLKLGIRLDGWHWAFGFGADMHSWRTLYPWLHGGLFVGPLAIDLDVTRPLPEQPAAAHDYTRHRYWREFERGFSTNGAGCRTTCICGRVFYNPNGGWDWEDGELDALAADPNATPVDWSCGEIIIDGRAFALDCSCWHERGRRILEWCLGHDDEIAEFLKEVKTAKELAARVAPTVT